jgi:hypothetical protein
VIKAAAAEAERGQGQPIQVQSPRRAALDVHHKTGGEPLVTPARQDMLNKEKKSDDRRAMTSNNKRHKAVAVAPSQNGIDALSAELQRQSTAMDQPSTTDDTENGPTMEDDEQTTNETTPTDATVPKRRRVAKVTTNTVPAMTSLPSAPAKRKCQGCVHGDLLDMTVMEPRHIRHYLEPSRFLEWATCAGDCANPIKQILLAAPSENLYYCDVGLKGFNAPDDDLNKKGMECGLVLCTPCHAKRAVLYDQEKSKNGRGNRRSSRRNNSNN